MASAPVGWRLYNTHEEARLARAKCRLKGHHPQITTYAGDTRYFVYCRECACDAFYHRYPNQIRK